MSTPFLRGRLRQMGCGGRNSCQPGERVWDLPGSRAGPARAHPKPWLMPLQHRLVQNRGLVVSQLYQLTAAQMLPVLVWEMFNCFNFWRENGLVNVG